MLWSMCCGTQQVLHFYGIVFYTFSYFFLFFVSLFFFFFFFFFSSRRRHTRSDRDWSSDVCSSDLDDEVQNDAAIDRGFPALCREIESKKKHQYRCADNRARCFR